MKKGFRKSRRKVLTSDTHRANTVTRECQLQMLQLEQLHFCQAFSVIAFSIWGSLPRTHAESNGLSALNRSSLGVLPLFRSQKTDIRERIIITILVIYIFEKDDKRSSFGHWFGPERVFLTIEPLIENGEFVTAMLLLLWSPCAAGDKVGARKETRKAGASGDSVLRVKQMSLLLEIYFSHCFIFTYYFIKLFKRNIYTLTLP